jgi:acyl carrier protein
MGQVTPGDAIAERVIRVLAETQHIDASTIRAESTFQELGIDSFDGINVLFAIESEFDINVPDEAAKQLRSVQDIIDGVGKLTTAKAKAAQA